MWRALTEDVHLAGWFPTTIEGHRVAGAPLRFSFRQSEGEPFDGEMLAFDPPSLMELRWGDDVLRFELAPDGAGSVLVLTVTLPEHGKAARDGAGWHVCLDQLEHVCDGTDLPWRASGPLAGGAPGLRRAVGAGGVGDRAAPGVAARARIGGGRRLSRLTPAAAAPAGRAA